MPSSYTQSLAAKTLSYTELALFSAVAAGVISPTQARRNPLVSTGVDWERIALEPLTPATASLIAARRATLGG